MPDTYRSTNRSVRARRFSFARTAINTVLTVCFALVAITAAYFTAVMFGSGKTFIGVVAFIIFVAFLFATISWILYIRR